MLKSGSALVLEARSLDLSTLPRVDGHVHTSWTDGKASVAEVYERACQVGLTAILYSEHCRKTSTGWFGDFAAEVRALPASPCRAFVGAEVKVELLDGTIDTVPAISDLCDYIMASVHRFPDENGEPIPFDAVRPEEAVDREFDLSWAALGNPGVDILGHVFGVSYRRYGVTPTEEKIRALIERAAETGVAIEVNSHYHSNPLQMINWCREYSGLISFGSNAHDLDSVGAYSLLEEELSAG